MIIIDSSVVIQIINLPRERQFWELELRDFGVLPIVRLEVLVGSRDRARYTRLHSFLEEFRQVEMPATSWEIAEELGYQIKSRGVTVSFQDLMIAASALALDCQVWTFDRDFERIQSICPSLQLY